MEAARQHQNSAERFDYGLQRGHAGRQRGRQRGRQTGQFLGLSFHIVGQHAADGYFVSQTIRIQAFGVCVTRAIILSSPADKKVLLMLRRSCMLGADVAECDDRIFLGNQFWQRKIS